MVLADFLETAQNVGSTCDFTFSGFEEIYLVPVQVSPNFSMAYLPEVIAELPTIDSIPQKLILEQESAQFRCQHKISELGSMWMNSLNLNSIRNISNWVQANRFQKFWLLMKQDGRWMISGDDAMPYTLRADLDSGKQLSDIQNWDIQLVAEQLRPYHLLEEDEGGEGPDPPPPPD